MEGMNGNTMKCQRGWRMNRWKERKEYGRKEESIEGRHEAGDLIDKPLFR